MSRLISTTVTPVFVADDAEGGRDAVWAGHPVGSPEGCSPTDGKVGTRRLGFREWLSRGHQQQVAVLQRHRVSAAATAHPITRSGAIRVRVRRQATIEFVHQATTTSHHRGVSSRRLDRRRTHLPTLHPSARGSHRARVQCCPGRRLARSSCYLPRSERRGGDARHYREVIDATPGRGPWLRVSRRAGRRVGGDDPRFLRPGDRVSRTSMGRTS